MKKYIDLTLRLIIFCLLLVLISCSQGNSSLSSDEYGTINISLTDDSSKNFSRSYEPENNLDDLTDFVLTGSWINGSRRTENELVHSWADYETVGRDSAIQVKNGSWTFKLTAKKGGSVYAAYSEPIDIRVYNTYHLYFNLQLTDEGQTGKGQMRLSLDLPDTNEYNQLVKVAVTYKKNNAAETLVDTDIITEITNPIVINKELPKDSYLVTAEFFTKDGEREISLGVWDDIVVIATDLLTKAEQTVSFQDIRVLNFNLKGGNWKEGTIIPRCYSRKEGLVLPDLSTVSQDGYYFYGWTDDYYSNELITEIEQGKSTTWLYAQWGTVNPVAKQNGIEVEMIIPENTYYIELVRMDPDYEQNTVYSYNSYNGDDTIPLTQTIHKVTDLFAESGKSYAYNFYVEYIEDGVNLGGWRDSTIDKFVTAITANAPQITYITDDISVDIMNDTLIFDASQISYSGFYDKPGFTKKTDVYYGNEDYGYTSFDLLSKSYKDSLNSSSWKNRIVQAGYLGLRYVSDDELETYYGGFTREFNENFPTFRISATSDHSIVAVEATQAGHLLTVFVPAGTKMIDLGFCRIGNGESVISTTDTMLTVLNKYESPDRNDSKYYQASYYDSNLNMVTKNSTNWISGAEETDYPEIPVLSSDFEVSFDEDTNSLVLSSQSQLDFGGEAASPWSIGFEYYYENNDHLRIRAEYTGGSSVSNPLTFTPDADAIHSLIRDPVGEYGFYPRSCYIKIPAENNIYYTIQLSSDYMPNYISIHKKQTVSFDSNGANSDYQVVVNYNEVLDEPETDPEKDGYIFGGWFFEGDDLRFDFENTPILTDITLKAKWLLDAVPEYNVAVNLVTDEMPLEYSIDQENGIIHFEFPYAADIYLDGDFYDSTWYEWDFDYKDLPKGFYTLDFIMQNWWGGVPSASSDAFYSYTLQIEVQ